MLFLRKDKEGVWIAHNYRGADIELKIRPADPEEAERLNKKHTKFEFAKDTDSRQMTKVKTVDTDAYIRDMADFLIEDFRGIGYSPEEPLEVNRENKYLVAMLAPTNAEKSLWNFIVETANELRTLKEDEAKELEKN